MSTSETILTRMMNDATFADAVIANAEKALAEYNLSAEDIAKFKSMSYEQFGSLAANPEERKSFGWENHNETLLS